MRGAPIAALAALASAACQGLGCPPAWIDDPPRADDALYAAGSAGPVFVDARAEDVALTRAVRVLADARGLDVERHLSARLGDERERVVVEALGPEGLLDDFAQLELVEQRACDDHVHVLVRLPHAP